MKAHEAKTVKINTSIESNSNTSQDSTNTSLNLNATNDDSVQDLIDSQSSLDVKT